MCIRDRVYDDLDRPPLRAAALTRALAPDGWRVEVLSQTPSTNAVVADRARAGEAAGLVVVAEQQSAGRGRLDRTWTSPARAGLTFSALVRPASPVAGWGWIPLLAGLAVIRALRSRAEVAAPGAVVIGVGLNVSARRDELPVESATSLALEGAGSMDRDTILRAVLRELTEVLADEQGSRIAYRARCTTVGQIVRLELPTRVVTGTAEAVDDDGRLVVDGKAYGAGDVVHLRPG